MKMLAQLAGDRVEWANQTTIHPLAILAVAVASGLILLGRRSHALAAVMATLCFVATAQRLVLAGLDFSIVRVLILLCLARIVARGEYKGFRTNVLDVMVLAWCAVAAAAYTVQIGTLNALIYKIGATVEYIGAYVTFRCLIRRTRDLLAFARTCAYLAIPVAGVMLVEKSTGRNAFAIFGGVPPITAVRDGRLRAQGAFAHPILAGVFWATLWPIVTTLYSAGRRPILAIAATLATLIIIVACASSTPMAVFGVAMFALSLWPLRRRIRGIVAAAAVVLVILHLVMKAPVWHLLARIDLAGGSTGYHRYQLIDNAISHFGEWAVVGTPSTGHWGHSQQDVANQFILEGVRGGLASMLLFLAMIIISFISLGEYLRREGRRRNRQGEIVAFAMGVSLFAHCAAFFGVSYFGQATVIFYGLLGIASTMRSDAWVKRPSAVPPATLKPGRLTHV